MMNSLILLDIGPIPPPPELVGFIAIILVIFAGVGITWKYKQRDV